MDNIRFILRRMLFKPRPVIIHVHIFKNAGSSFDFSLKKNFGEAFIDHREDGLILAGKSDFLYRFLLKHPNIKAFSSHSIHFNIINNKSFHYYPVYFLRDPLERVLSVYHFEKIQVPSTTPGSIKAKEAPLEDYVRWYLEESSPATIRNAQTIFLSGMGPSPKKIDEKFAQATLVVRSPNIFVGMVDRYDESMVVLEQKLKKSFRNIDLSYVKKNIGNYQSVGVGREKITAMFDGIGNDIVNKLISKNEYDMELYSMGNEKLDKEIEGIGNFPELLVDFKQRCRDLTG